MRQHYTCNDYKTAIKLGHVSLSPCYFLTCMRLWFTNVQRPYVFVHRLSGWTVLGSSNMSSVIFENNRTEKLHFSLTSFARLHLEFQTTKMQYFYLLTKEVSFFSWSILGLVGAWFCPNKVSCRVLQAAVTEVVETGMVEEVVVVGRQLRYRPTTAVTETRFNSNSIQSSFKDFLITSQNRISCLNSAPSAW